MHEYSIMQNIIDMVSEEMRPYCDFELQAFTVQVGAMSGLEPALLESAFEMIRPDTLAEHAKMQINYVPLLCRCENCSNEFEVKSFNFICSGCDAPKTIILQGEDTILESLELEEVEVCQSRK